VKIRPLCSSSNEPLLPSLMYFGIPSKISLEEGVSVALLEIF
jgi:hypothetical protein